MKKDNKFCSNCSRSSMGLKLYVCELDGTSKRFGDTCSKYIPKGAETEKINIDWNSLTGRTIMESNVPKIEKRFKVILDNKSDELFIEFLNMHEDIDHIVVFIKSNDIEKDVHFRYSNYTLIYRDFNPEIFEAKEEGKDQLEDVFNFTIDNKNKHLNLNYIEKYV